MIVPVKQIGEVAGFFIGSWFALGLFIFGLLHL